MGSSIERLVEIFVEKKDDPSWARTITYLLKIAGSPGIEKVFQRLEAETDTSTRMRLLRVIGQSGPAGIAVAKSRLKHAQWYVVRNACNILADLNDPDLVDDVKVALDHEDERVQQAAVNVIMKNRSPRRAEVFANSLPRLKSHMLEKVLDELLLMREPGSLPGLQTFLMDSDSTKPAQLQKAVQLVSVIPGDQASEVLGKVLFASKLPLGVRRAALIALSRKPAAVPILAEFAKFAGNDPLAGECQTFLKAMSA
jgi:HEAT repeat protein